MDKISIICIAIAVVAVVFGIVMMVLSQKHQRELVEGLEDIVDLAIQGRLKKEDYEGMDYEELAEKMNRYLKLCRTRNRKSKAGKDGVKTLPGDIAGKMEVPMNGLFEVVKSLEEEELADTLKEKVREIYTQTYILKYIVDKLLYVSGLGEGLSSIHPKPQQLHDMILEAGKRMKAEAAKKQMQIRYKKTELEAVFDKEWTTEALCCILDNAVKYSPMNTQIKISVIPYEMYVKIDVTDSGIGIIEKDTEQIFEEFYRSQAATYEQGLGIGLYLAKNIIEEQGGYIKVTSIVGKGSMFSVYIPRS